MRTNALKDWWKVNLTGRETSMREEKMRRNSSLSFQLRKHPKVSDGTELYRRWRNHLYYSHAIPDREEAVERMRSFLMHITGQHEWEKVEMMSEWDKW